MTVQRNLALFDLDNTLLAGDSDYGWSNFLIQKGLLDATTHQARNDRFYEDYKQGRLDIQAFLSFQLEPLSRYSREFLDDLHRLYMIEVIHPMITTKAIDLVKQHRDNGDILVIITATNRFVTAPIAKAFGIHNLIASEAEELAGRFTGRPHGVPCFQEGKVSRLLAWLAEESGATLSTFEKSYFYSDSYNDLPLLKLVTHPIVVDADMRLLAYAKQQHWKSISLR